MHTKVVRLAGLSILIFFSCGPKPETTTPKEESITESVYASGTVKSRNQYQVFATVTGTIDEILVQEGALVKAGQPIIRLKSNAAALASENARLGARYAEIDQNKNRLNELRLASELANAKLQNDSLLWIRQNSLYQQNIGSKAEWEQRKLAFENAKVASRSAAIRYQELARQINLSADQARLNAAIATQQLQDFTIASKINGRLYQLQKVKGELVTPQMPIAIIGDANNFLIELEIDETDIARVQPGQRVLTTLSSYPDKVWEATVSEIRPILDERSKLFTLEAQFIETPGTLFPNLTAEANIIIRSKAKAFTIPRVFLLNDSTVRLESGETRIVKVGLKDYQKVEIVSGLTVADVLVKP
jgi:HlyD family secretion protein